MKNRRNLGVAAVTAAVVTTALVGTTLPDLMADRASDSVQQQQESTAADSVVTTDLPDVPSAKEISTAKESSQATDQMITEINERLSQANQRALEIEASLQMEQQDALAAEEEAREAARAAEEAQEDAADDAGSAAAEEYQDGETSPEDVLLSEDDNALADAATDDQLTEQAEDDAATAEQEADESEALASQAEDAARANTNAQDSLNSTEVQSATDFSELGEAVRDLLETGADLEGYEDLGSYYALVLGNSDLIDEDGEVDTEALGWHIATLRDDATETPSAESLSAEDETADGSAEGEEGEASPSAEPEADDEAVAAAEEEEERSSEEDEDDSEAEEASDQEEASNDEEASADENTSNDEEASADENTSNDEEASADENTTSDEEAAGPGHTLSQYLPGTRALVEQLAELEEESISETFQRLVDDSDFTTDSGLLDHSAVNAEVNRQAPSSEESAESDDTAEAEESSPSPSPSPSPSESPSPSQSADSESAESAEPAAVHSLDDYQSGTTGLVERIAELNDESVSAAFDRLVDDSDFTDSNGHLNHAALQREANRLAPSPSPSPSSSGSDESSGSSGSSDSGSSGSSGSSDSGNSGSSSSESSSESSSTPSHSLGQYRAGTRGLVEQIAELNGDGVSATFSRLADSSDFTDSNGLLDHSALQSEVNRLSPSQSQESSGSGGGSSSDSGSDNDQSSGSDSGSQDASAGAGSGAAQIAADWATARVNEPGTHYVLGGNGPMAWDCSSLTQQAMAQAGVSIPRTSQAQFNGGQAVSLNNLQVGDLVFWGGNSSIYHVAIYIGDGQIAHARNPQSGLSVTSVNYAFQSPNPTAKRYF